MSCGVCASPPGKVPDLAATAFYTTQTGMNDPGYVGSNALAE